MRLELITNKKNLRGSNYFEFLPRKFDGQHWNDDAVFVWYEDISFFHRLLGKHLPDYCEYCYMTADETQAKALANDLLVYAEEVEKAVSAGELGKAYGVILREIDKLEDEWDTAQAQLASMLEDLGLWIQQNVSEGGTLSVLGL